MKDVKFLAIFIGLVIDIGGSLAFGLILGIAIGIVLGIHLASHGGNLSEITAKAHALQGHPLFLLMCLGSGSCFTLLGSFVTGWMARTAPVRNALLMGTLSAALSTPFFFGHPFWYNALGTVLTFGAAAGGGFLAEAVLSRRRTPVT